MESRNKVFLDTDVTLDHLADRQPIAEYAHRIFGLAETGNLIVYVSPLSFSNLYYILRKALGHSNTLRLLGKLKRLVHISAVTGAEIEAALGSSFNDFEDAIQYFCAKKESGISAIITRNQRDYFASEINVISPNRFVQLNGI